MLKRFRRKKKKKEEEPSEFQREDDDDSSDLNEEEEGLYDEPAMAMGDDARFAEDTDYEASGHKFVLMLLLL
eukprot:m.199147 g.199147  ORF g.199147 m.199147 type:complete len:72 (+) comp13694_c3_seq13:95-310(+)